jgi:hypothetical protein
VAVGSGVVLEPDVAIEVCVVAPVEGGCVDSGKIVVLAAAASYEDIGEAPSEEEEARPMGIS